MEHIQDLWNTALTIFVTGDFVGMGIKVAAIIVASLFLQSAGSLLNGTLVALVLSTLGSLLRAIVDASGGISQLSKNFDGATAKRLAVDHWNAILGLNGKTLLVYALTFGVGVFIAYAIRVMIFGNRDSRDSGPSTRMSMAPIAMAAPATPIVQNQQPQVAQMHADQHVHHEAASAPAHDDHTAAADAHAEHAVHDDAAAAHAVEENHHEPAEAHASESGHNDGHHESASDHASHDGHGSHALADAHAGHH